MSARSNRQASTRLLAALVALIGALVVSASAGATVTCSLGAGATLSVFTDEMTAIHRSGNSIVVTGTGCSGAPTVTNTDLIVVTGSLGLDEQVSIDQSIGGALAPGLTPEGTGLDEIEVDLSGLDVSGGGAIVVAGTSGDDTITLGSLGLSLNADDDLDLVLPAVTGPLRIFGVGGDDAIVATGGHGSGGPSPNRALYLSGGPGNDILDATDGDLGPGSDQVQGDGGDDQLIGDSSADAVLYIFSPTAVVVHLETSPRTAVGEGNDLIVGIDNVFGSSQDDVLFGHGLSNVLFGMGGNDEIHGGDSQDLIDGGDGDDVLHGEGGEDQITGGAGDDVLSEIFGNGFQPQLSGGPGNDRYEIAFGEAAGSMLVEGDDDSDEIVVTCTPGKVTDTPGGPGAGTLSRGGESVAYTGVETITIPPECQTNPPAPPPGPGGPPVAGSSPAGSSSTGPGAPPASPTQQVATVPTLGAIIVLGTRRGRIVRLDARPSFLVLAGAAVDPLAWVWRVRRAGRAPSVFDSALVVLRARRTVRSAIEIQGQGGLLGAAAVRLPAGVRRMMTLRLPDATLAGASLRAMVAMRAAPIATRREQRALPRALAAGHRVLSIVAVGDRTFAVRIRITRPGSNRWLKRLERLSPDRLRRAVRGQRIVLARGARLAIVPSRAGNRLSLTFVNRLPGER